MLNGSAAFMAGVAAILQFTVWVVSRHHPFAAKATAAIAATASSSWISPYWSTLFGALTAFLLGMIANWLKDNREKRTAGNVALMTLSQMCSLTDNLSNHYVFDEPARAMRLTGRSAVSIMLRHLVAIPTELPRIDNDSLGFLVDSHDPDILNRLLFTERSFAQTIALVHSHSDLTKEFQSKMSADDPSGRRNIERDDVVRIAGAKLLIGIDDAVEQLRDLLPKTANDLYSIANQLSYALQMQFPMRAIARIARLPRNRFEAKPKGLPKPPIWRRVTRWIFEWIRGLIQWRKRVPTMAAEQGPRDPPIVERFYVRSFEESAEGTNPPKGAP